MAMIKTLGKIKKQKGFTIMQSQFLSKTPFDKFVFVLFESYLSLKEATKVSNNLDDLIDSYCVEEESFKIGQKNLKMTPNDISIIFGLLCQEKVFSLFLK